MVQREYTILNIIMENIMVLDETIDSPVIMLPELELMPLGSGYPQADYRQDDALPLPFLIFDDEDEDDIDEEDNFDDMDDDFEDDFDDDFDDEDDDFDGEDDDYDYEEDVDYDDFDE
jgi:hypothetical protein